MKGYWSQGLYAAVEDESLHIYSDEDMVVIKDKYPKARIHYLVLPKKKLQNLKSLTKEDVPLLTKMYDRACLLTKDETELRFRYGYHAVPSMGLLHLHVISQDFDSSSLKTKKHWNSFTSEYFIDSSVLIAKLDESGSVGDMSSKSKLLENPLRCHLCKAAMKNMPTLKTHYAKCYKGNIAGKS